MLADRLRLAVGRLARRLRQESLGEITPSQLSVLATLDRHGEMTMGQLASIERVSRPSATGITTRLVDRGLVSQRPDSDDGRCSVVSLTTEGVALLEKGREERTAFLTERLEGLSDEGVDILTRAVAILDGMVAEE